MYINSILYLLVKYLVFLLRFLILLGDLLVAHSSKLGFFSCCVLCPVATMAAPGGGKSPPSPTISAEDAFKRLLLLAGKKLVNPPIPKFIKKLDAIPEIVLPEEKPIKIALALAE